MSEAAKKAPVAEARSLVKKLAEVMGEVERIAKNGHNDHFNYDFATESDIAAAVRGEMAKRALMLVPSVEKTEWEQVQRKNGTTKLCTLTVKYRLMDGDSGEEMEFTILGQGEDSLDKATYKAMTGATKYALLKLFLVPTGDDPEDNENRHTPGRPAPQQSRPSAPPSNAQLVGDDLVIPFGKAKGKRLSEATDDQLSWLLTAFKKSVDANDKTYHAKNVKQLEAAQAEAQRRVGPVASETTQANGPDAWALIFELLQKHNLSGQAAASRIKGITGKTDRKQLNLTDYHTLKAALEAVAL